MFSSHLILFSSFQRFMYNSFRTFSLVVAAGSALLLGSCDADNSDIASSGDGSISGQVQPTNAVVRVSAVSSTNRTFSRQTGVVGGTYSFTNIPDGTYTLSYTPAAGYRTPAAQSVSVSGGGAATAAPVTAVASGSNPAAGTNAFAVDGGTSTTASLATASEMGGSLAIVLGNASGASVSMAILGFSGTTGTYPLTGTSLLSYSLTSGTTVQQWSTAGSGGAGSVTITAVGTSPRSVSGTFTATAVPGQGATGNKAITGSFSNLAY
jgi:hypothetical protein